MRQLAEIQKELGRGKTERFQQWIVAPKTEMLHQFLRKEYPSLVEEASGILEDVFRKFQQQIKKWESNHMPLEVDTSLQLLIRKECKLAEPSEENRKKNLGLSRAEFKNLCSLLKQGKETLIEKVYLSHFKQCMKFLTYNENASRDEAYNSSMDALYEIRKDLMQDKIFYGNLAYYFTYRAKSKLFKWRKKQKQPTLPLIDMDFEEAEKTETELIQKELVELVSAAINKLCADCKSIIKSFYYNDKSLKEIAGKMEKSHAAIRKQTTRCRDKLRKHLGEKFYEQFSHYLNK